MPIDINLYSKQLNLFLDEAAEFRAVYEDNPPLHAVATKITEVLLMNRDLPFDNPQHPFNRFYSLAPIAEVIQEEIQDRDLRGYVVSFFHSGGANHEDLCEFLDAFWDWAEYSDSDYEHSDEEDASTESDSVIDLTQDDDTDEEEEEASRPQTPLQNSSLRDMGAQLPRLQIPPASQQRWDDFFEPVRRRLDFVEPQIAAPRLVRG